ncbi:uncharacterized protein LOC126902107 [Daktulosphaira vitifoliae]|uniref:uncharacterized protein LOC126902107 n=1 Tax=Daktulosphaira vitifoliae TaxID=58002 RepID=UPI0021AABD3C|nr:uncharacterized protein LOC126902107 [Daktulosphaira vitifoliae]
MTLVNGYAPTEEKGNQIKEKFYSELETIYECIPKIIMGDFNAKIGKKRVFEPTIGQESLYQVSNDNRIRHLQDLRICGSVVPFSHIREYTNRHGCHQKEPQITRLTM